MIFEFLQQLGLMQYPLLLCSVVAVAICLERLVFMIRSYASKEVAYGKLSDCLSQYKYQPKAIRDEVVSMAVKELQMSYDCGIKSLRFIATISPLIGLLGTILGLISAFKVIAAQTSPISPNVIASGLWEAMLTTAAGLMIALPALLMAHLLTQFSNKQLGSFCVRLNQLSLVFEVEKKAGVE